MNTFSICRRWRSRLRGSLIVLACGSLWLCLNAHGQTLDEGNRAFATGHFPQSTAAFQAVLTQKGYSAPVLFDLGNSYARQSKLAEAILAYKRAFWLSPGDQDTAANLALAEQQAGLPATKTSWPEKIAHVLSANAWAWLVTASLTVLCAAVFAAAKFPERRASFRLIGIAAAVCLVAAIGAIILWSAQLHEAVVMDPNASALISPFPGAQAAFAPPPGETVAVRKSYGDFFLVQDAAGHAGWIAQSQVALTIPPPTTH
jgi:tetratricopeptide (TPR) repeat protein